MVEFDDIAIPKDIHYLIVEDEQDVAEVIQMRIEELMFEGEIHVVDNIEAAKTILNQKRIHFIISDWNLDGPTGLDLLKYIRAHKELENVPFLMVTANDNISEMLEATELGSSEYLVKPWTQGELKEKIFSAWYNHSKQNATSN